MRRIPTRSRIRERSRRTRHGGRSKTRRAAAAAVDEATPAGYMPGFGNDFETEALPGALPVGQNSPQRTAYGLYAEQLSGSPFTAPRGDQRALLALPHPPLGAARAASSARPTLPLWKTAPSLGEHDRPIGQLRWGPVPIPQEKLTFLTGMRTMTTAGDVNTQAGMAAHIYLVTQSMENDYFYNADGELLVVPQEGALRFFTEFGRIEAEPGEICVIPRGVKFKVELVGRPGARLRVRELRRQVHAARPRADRRQLPRQPARLQDAGGGLRGPRGDEPADREVVRRLPRRRDRPLAARRRRLARQLRALQVRPAPLLAGRRDPLRPSRSVDLHGADRAVGDSRHRQRRLRDLPGALVGGGAQRSARPGIT